MGKLILIRHGLSTWNAENRFTGWVDVDLSEKGVFEAEKSGKLLKELGLVYEACFTSCLKRAIKTLEIILLTGNISRSIVCVVSMYHR